MLMILTLIVQPALGDDITTYAGTGSAGYSGDGGPATSAKIWRPSGLTVAANGDIYFADRDNNVVRKVDASTGDISTVAGGGVALTGDGGLATSGWMNEPQTMAVDAAGNVYIADTQNHRIRKIDVGTGFISTIAGTGVQGYSGDGGAATSAKLNQPKGIDIDSAGNVIFSDTDNHRIRMITPGGTISTIAGTGGEGFSGDGGPATAAKIKKPGSVSIDGADVIYFADTRNHRIRKFAVGGNISTVAGNGNEGFAGDGGLAVNAEFNQPQGVWVDWTDRLGFDTVFGSFQGGVRDLQIATQVTLNVDGTLTDITAYIKGGGSDVRYAVYSNLAGDPDALIVETAVANAPATTDWFTITVPATPLTAGTYWLALSLDANAQRYYYDGAGGQNRENANAAVTNGYTATWGAATASNSRRVAIYASFTSSVNTVYVADTENHRIRKFTDGGNISTVAGNGNDGFSGDGGTATAAEIDTPQSVSVNDDGDFFIADEKNNRIRMVDKSTGNISTYAGTGAVGYSGDGGPATSAEMHEPHGVFVDTTGDLYLADTGNHVIRKIDAATQVISRVGGTPRDMGVGDGLLATNVFLGKIEDVAIDSAGNLFIAATDQVRVRRVDAGTGVISTVIGSGSEFAPAVATDDVMLLEPRGVAVDGAGNVYVTDSDFLNSRIVKYAVATSTYATVAGTGAGGFSGDGGLATAATIREPRGIAFDASDNFYIADTENHRIRKVDAATSIISTIAGNGSGGFSGDGGSATAAQIKRPEKVALDDAGNVYIADTENHRIRKVTLSDGNITTIAGTGVAGYSGDGGDATLAMLRMPAGVGFIDGTPSYLYIGDSDNHRVRVVTITGRRVVNWKEVDPQN